MAKIWYSVLGDGMGHALRSHSVLQYLTDKHDVRITASDKAYPFLKSHYPDITTEIKGTEFVYEDNKVVMRKTIQKYMRELPGMFKHNYKEISQMLLKFRPDIVITDFESAAHYFAFALRIPCISIDNVHVLTECKVKLPKKKSYNLTAVRTFIKYLHPRSDYFLLTAFADVKPKNKRTIIVPPVIRQQVLSLEPEEKDHILVYQTSPTNTKMIPVLEESRLKFKVYGMGGHRNSENIQYKQFSEKDFLEDLRTSRYVIINGGFTVLSEALYLKKPILAIPIEKQFEQEFNAYSIKERGYGDYTTDLTLEDILRFEHNLSKYKNNLRHLKRWSNQYLYKTLETIITRLLKRRKPKYDLLEKW